MKIPAGKPPQSKKAKVVRVESTDDSGESFEPPQFEYWVVSTALPPEVYSSGHLSFAEAMEWLLANNYSPGG